MCISFSNRLFFQKAVAVWVRSSDIERIEVVGRYLHFAEGFESPPVAFDISPSATSDPLFIVKAIRS